MPPEDAARALLDRLTLAERIGQLNLLPAGEGLATGLGAPTALAQRLDSGQVGAIFGTKSLASARAMQERALAGSRLKVPLFFAEDVIHGHRTVFPLPIALACSWDMALIEATAAFAAAEASAEGLHQVYAPMIDVSRDPRWGRVAESPGEDPLLACRFATAMVRGLQGDDFTAPGKVAACLKHFVAYGASQSGRDYDNASLAWEDLIATYLPPFRAGVEAGGAGVMAGFNAVNKVPMHAHGRLIEGWLRGGAGFDGLVVSDYTGVMELAAHGMGDRAVSALRALQAGIDMDMVGEDYVTHLPTLAEIGCTSPDTGLSMAAAEVVRLIDRACLRVLIFKARLGLLDDPFRGLDGTTSAPSRADGEALARRAATASAVLLKNPGILPLARTAKVALVGPFADDTRNMLGTWAVSGDPSMVRSLRAVFEDRQVTPALARGCNVVDEPWLADRLNVHGPSVDVDPREPQALIDEALAAAAGADMVVLALGEGKEAAGESSSLLVPELPLPQWRLAAALKAAGHRLVVVIFAGRPLALGNVATDADALLYAWHGGIRGPDGVADLLYGDAEPSGRLAVTLPVSPGEMPLHYGGEATGRPWTGRFQKFRTGWLDLPDDAIRFPFGFGLGYAQVEYGAPSLASSRIAGPNATAEVSVAVANRGTRPAVETVQLYLSDPVARITRPSRWLADFARIDLAPGETRSVTFRVTRKMAEYVIAPSLEAAETCWDPGIFVLHTGPNSRDTQSVELTWDA